MMETRIRLASGKFITLNEQQVEALTLIRSWMKNEAPCTPKGSKLLFCLEGFAGTGKTTIVKEAIDWFMDTIGRWDKPVGVTAPTHKAKKVVADATGLEGKTIQSLIGLGPNTDVLHFDINNPEFSLINEPGLRKYSIILIDEASMLNTELFELLHSQAVQTNTKILFMCDSAQLPPIGEEISPVVISPLVGCRYQLTKVERQAEDNPLMLVYDAIRSNITSREDSFKHATSLLAVPKPELSPFDPNEEGSHDFDARMDAWNAIKPEFMGAEFLTDLNTFGGRTVTAFVSQKFQEDPNHCKVLCWTNKKVKFWNNAVRGAMMQKRRDTLEPQDTVHDAIVMPGEIVMGYVNYTKGISNAGEYKITSLEYDEETVEFGPFINGDRFQGRELSASFTVYRVMLSQVDNEINTFSCNIIEPTTENYKKFLFPFNWYHAQGVFHKRWPMYYGWKSNYMLLTDIRDVNKKLIVKKDLDYAYALSTHKAQGSTYNQVFIDEVDIDQLENQRFAEYLYEEDRKLAIKEKRIKKFNQKYPNFGVFYTHKLIEKNKLKYVALSRPRFKAVVFTNKTD